MSDINGVYCSNCNCEYHEDGDCEYEGSLKLDEKWNLPMLLWAKILIVRMTAHF